MKLERRAGISGRWGEHEVDPHCVLPGWRYLQSAVVSQDALRGVDVLEGALTMIRAIKVWLPGLESEPEGLSHSKTAPKNWFRELPEVAAELYALEEHKRFDGLAAVVCVRDDQGELHRFEVTVVVEPVVCMRKL